MYGTIKVKCGNQKSIIRMEMLEDEQIDVQCKFNPPMDITKTSIMEENFVGNVTQMIMKRIIRYSILHRLKRQERQIDL